MINKSTKYNINHFKRTLIGVVCVLIALSGNCQKLYVGVIGGITTSGFYDNTRNHVTRGHFGLSLYSKLSEEDNWAYHLNMGYQGNGGSMYVVNLDQFDPVFVNSAAYNRFVNSHGRMFAGIYSSYFTINPGVEYDLNYKNFYATFGMKVAYLLKADFLYYRTQYDWDVQNERKIEYNVEFREDNIKDRMNRLDIDMVTGIGNRLAENLFVEYTLNLGLRDLGIMDNAAVLAKPYSNHYHNVSLRLYLNP